MVHGLGPDGTGRAATLAHGTDVDAAKAQHADLLAYLDTVPGAAVSFLPVSTDRLNLAVYVAEKEGCW